MKTDLSTLAAGVKSRGYDTQMDADCLPLCDALNSLPGISTFESCCGHGQTPFRVFFIATTIESLVPILQCTESSGWHVEAYWSNGGEFPAFVLEGPTGPATIPGGASDFAEWLQSVSAGAP